MGIHDWIQKEACGGEGRITDSRLDSRLAPGRKTLKQASGVVSQVSTVFTLPCFPGLPSMAMARYCKG